MVYSIFIHETVIKNHKNINATTDVFLGIIGCFGTWLARVTALLRASFSVIYSDIVRIISLCIIIIIIITAILLAISVLMNAISLCALS